MSDESTLRAQNTPAGRLYRMYEIRQMNAKAEQEAKAQEAQEGLRNFWTKPSIAQAHIRQQAFPQSLSPCMRVIETRGTPVEPIEQKQAERRNPTYEIEPVEYGSRAFYCIFQVWRDEQGKITDKIQSPRGYYAKHRAEEKAAHLNSAIQETKPARGVAS